MLGNASDVGRLHVLEAITDTALGHMDLDLVQRTILERVRELFEVDTATVLLRDRAGDRLNASVTAGMEEEVFQGVSVPIGSGFAGQVAESRVPVRLTTVDRTTVVNPLLWEKGLRSLLGVPMLARDELVGVLHIGSITDREFTDEDVALLQVVAGRLAQAVQVDTLAAERAAAAALQRGLLPGTLPSVAGLEFSGRYVPGSHSGVGGDWYDVFPLPDERIGIVIGDVSGRGLAAAVIMGRLRSALRAYALDHHDPARVLTKLDRKSAHFETDAMATVCYSVVDLGRKRLTTSLAGHLPPVVAEVGHDGALLALPVDPPIGPVESLAPRRATTVDITPGTVIAYYTDGLVERRGTLIDDGLAALAAAVVAEPPGHACARIMAAMIGAHPVDDDVALLVMRADPA